MKKLVILFLLMSITAFSQKTNEIEKLLNKELFKELQRQIDNSYFEGDSLIVVQPFKIEYKILSITIQKKSYYDNEFYQEKQEIALDKIISILKDINVIFETETDAVKITQTSKEGVITKSNYNLFFLHLSAEKNNESLAKNIVKSFKKEGYTIEKKYWFD
ncbi:hypothetical protein [uncultured Flavobacterium sp.]|uniref:hypothetical protein n=1 Tax=uncultured Flavobacterium sp. TaxID=165435 RepID=UPI0030EE3162|tara:strand:- start:11923 stop:12405 length:483 start_codon:yes stop_codon:yes gene_type:complete